MRERRTDDGGVVRDLRDLAGYPLQVAAAVSARRAGSARGPEPSSGAASEPDGVGHRSSGVRTAASPHELGTEEVEDRAGAKRSGRGLAGGQHDRRDRGTGGLDGAAQEASARAAVQQAVCGGRCAQPRVVRGFQRVVQSAGRHTDPSADYQRCLQPVSAAVPASGKTNGQQVQAIFEAAFREYGLPEAIRTDNGAPFASRAIAGLSRLAVWWMKLGIVPERIAAGHPEQNGRQERVHRTLKQETASPPAATRRAQQAAFDRFRREYNQERPHEALQMQTPSAVYQRSEREYPARVPEPEYGGALQVRRMREQGQFRWKSENIFLSGALEGESIGLQQTDERSYDIYFATFPIGRFDSAKRVVLPLPKKAGDFKVSAREPEPSPPSPAPHPPAQQEQKVSGICPV